MGKALVVFGSASDKPVYDTVVSVLRQEKENLSLRVCSAHRTPEMLDTILSDIPFDLAICGAGLSAALPGVVAAKTLKPVLGIPVSGNFEGVDAYLSTTQIPPGIAVLGTPIDDGETAAHEACKILQQTPSKVVLVQRNKDADSEKAVNKAEAILTQFDVPYSRSNVPQYDASDAVYLDFVPIPEIDLPRKSGRIVIYIPLAAQGGRVAQLPQFTRLKHGLWVGLGRGENAALAAVQILNRNGKYSEKLTEFRREQAEKVRASNEKEQTDE